MVTYIESICSGCGKKLRVAAEHAGRSARCPQCNSIYTVPAAQPGAASPASSPADDGSPAAGGSAPETLSAEQTPVTPAPLWSMKTPDGVTYGPVDRDQIERWVAEGRVAADCELRKDDGDWQRADEWFAALRPPPVAPEAHPTAHPSANPFAETPAVTGPQHAGLPHRGALILTLGIIGMFVGLSFGCPVLSIAAWVMGNNDMRLISQGRMDPSGIGLVQAGRVLGMIISILWILVVIGLCLLLVVASVAGW